MKTIKKFPHTKFTTIAMLMLFSQSSFSQSLKTEINQAINDYLVPIIALVIVVCVIIGLVKNWDEINDKHTRKEGLINVGWILLYGAIVLVAIGAIVTLVANLKIKI